MTVICNDCQTYLDDNRWRLIPHLGRHVQRTGRPPARVVARLVAAYHRLGHPMKPPTTPPPHGGDQS